MRHFGSGGNSALRGRFDSGRTPHAVRARLGLAYKLTPKTVIRAGGGIFYQLQDRDLREFNGEKTHRTVERW